MTGCDIKTNHSRPFRLSAKGVRVLRVARGMPGLTVEQIAAVVACHPTTVRRHLRTSGSLAVAARDRAAAAPTRCAQTFRVAAHTRVHAVASARPLPALPALLDLLVTDVSHSVRRSAATHPRCMPRTLARASVSSDELVRVRVAEHPNCPPRALAQLAEDGHYLARVAAARHRSTPVVAISRLAASPDVVVREIAAANARCPPSTLALLAGDTHVGVRAVVAANANCPSATLARLAGGDDWKVAQAAAANRSCPPDALARAAGRSSNAPTRDAALANPSCPSDAVDAARLGAR